MLQSGLDEHGGRKSNYFDQRPEDWLPDHKYEAPDVVSDVVDVCK